MELKFLIKYPNNVGTLSGRYTLFPEKILESLGDNYDFNIYDYCDLEEPIGYENDVDLNCFQEWKPKHHTIREDKRNRWKVGSEIYFTIDSDKDYELFAPVVKVKGIQGIEIKYFTAIGYEYTIPMVYIDGRLLNYNECETLAINDGFERLVDFFQYFNKDFKGKIIHWTDLKY